LKNEITQKSIMTALQIVVNAAAKILWAHVNECVLGSLVTANFTGYVRIGMTEVQHEVELIPIKMAKQIDSRNPSVQPLATSSAVVAVKINPIVKTQNRVRMNDRDDKKTTRPEKPSEIAAEPNAAWRMFPFVSYHQKSADE
jgi:hypothetical protein